MLPKDKRHWTWKAEWVTADGASKCIVQGHWEGAHLTAQEVSDAVYARLKNEEGHGHIWVEPVRLTAIGQRIRDAQEGLR